MQLPGFKPSTNNTRAASPSSAAKIIPQLSTPHSVTGFKLATTTTERPLISSGLYHKAIPEATTRGVPLPSSSVSFSNFLAFLIGSQSTTRATRKSTLAKSSKLISERNATFSVSSSAAAAAAAFSASSANTFSTSIRANSGSGVPTV